MEDMKSLPPHLCQGPQAGFFFLLSPSSLCSPGLPFPFWGSPKIGWLHPLERRNTSHQVGFLETFASPPPLALAALSIICTFPTPNPLPTTRLPSNALLLGFEVTEEGVGFPMYEDKAVKNPGKAKPICFVFPPPVKEQTFHTAWSGSRGLGSFSLARLRCLVLHAGQFTK